MKKRILLFGLTAVMSVFALTGCGGSDKKNYIADIEEIVDVNDKINTYNLEDTEEIKKAQDAIDDMSVKTDEGKKIKDDFKELFQLLKDVYDIADSDAPDDSKLTELEDKYDEIDEKLTKDGEAFVDAAEKAGVDDDDIDDLVSAL